MSDRTIKTAVANVEAYTRKCRAVMAAYPDAVLAPLPGGREVFASPSVKPTEAHLVGHKAAFGDGYSATLFASARVDVPDGEDAYVFLADSMGYPKGVWVGELPADLQAALARAVGEKR